MGGNGFRLANLVMFSILISRIEKARNKITRLVLSAAVERAGDATAGAALNDNLSSEAE